MKLSGQSIVGFTDGAGTGLAFRARNPRTGEAISPDLLSAPLHEVDRAAQLAGHAFAIYGRLSGHKKAKFLRQIAANIEAIAAEIIERAGVETALPQARLQGETARTCGQLRLFAQLIEEGSWAMARIDRADPDRKPAPKPDIRSLLRALGPVVVFGASNFPLAFSVAGGDTASALAAGNPVIVKAHPAHPGTSELVGRAVASAAARSRMPAGIFSLLHGTKHSLGSRLVRHKAAKAVGFTGSRT